MQKYKISALVVSALTVVSMLSGCVRKVNPSSSDTSDTSSESSSSSSSSSSEGEQYILSNVDQKDEFVEFLGNKAKNPQDKDGFYDNTEPYTVGDDNAFNVKPELSVLDKNYQPVSADKWDHDFIITATMDGGTEKVGSTHMTVVDAKKCDVKFTEAAIGHSFTISVTPTSIPETKVSDWTKTFTVSVVDGFNVYDAKELGYFDTREADSTYDENGHLVELGFKNKWQEFKTANGLDPNIKPAALLIHNDLRITTNDIPSNFFYTTEEATALNDAKAAGSLKDRAYIYRHMDNTHVTVNGNYFGIEYGNTADKTKPSMPLIVRHENNTTAVGEVVAHSSLFRTDNGTADFKNFKVSGNAPRATSNDDKIFGGGLMFLKATSYTSEVNFANVIGRDLFITVMTEKPDGEKLDVVLSKTKCYNNYNSFFYNWGGHFKAIDSSFENCGGPVIIQDHTPEEEKYEDNNGLVVKGFAPKSEFINCETDNYVLGEEAWFQSFNAVALMPTIKSLSDLFFANSLPKSFVLDEEHHGALYQALSAQSKNSFLNFKVVNKSSEVEGLTTISVCGDAEITSGEKTELFDYRQPANDAVVKAYGAYQANPSTETQQALIATAEANGVEFAEDYSDVAEKVQAYITNVCTLHMIIRGLNETKPQGAPVVDFGNGLPLATTDGSKLYEATSFVAFKQEQIAAPVEYKDAITAKQKALIGDNMALYYNGMMIVLGLAPYAA